MTTDKCIIIVAQLRDKLNKRGFTRSAADINDILYKLIEDRYTLDPEENPSDVAEEEASDAFVALNLVGLRGDVKPEMPIGGVGVNPFFHDVGEPN
jgi:hypothetical protein